MSVGLLICENSWNDGAHKKMLATYININSFANNMHHMHSAAMMMMMKRRKKQHTNRNKTDNIKKHKIKVERDSHKYFNHRKCEANKKVAGSFVVAGRQRYFIICSLMSDGDENDKMLSGIVL